MSGSGFAPNTLYNYGFGSSSTTLSSAPFSFTSTSGGAIPSNTYINVPNTLNPGSIYVDIVLPTSSSVIISALFTVTAITSPSPAVGHGGGYTVTINGIPYNLFTSLDFENTLDLQVNQGTIEFPDFLTMVNSNAIAGDIAIYRDGVLKWRGVGSRLPPQIRRN